MKAAPEAWGVGMNLFHRGFAKRDAAIEKAQAALGEARREHEETASEIEKDFAAPQRRADKEEAAGMSSENGLKRICASRQ